MFGVVPSLFSSIVLGLSKPSRGFFFSPRRLARRRCWLGLRDLKLETLIMLNLSSETAGVLNCWETSLLVRDPLYMDLHQ